ncbi:MAG: phosphatase PAP2 family protein [Nanoarchaeota archaeon]
MQIENHKYIVSFYAAGIIILIVSFFFDHAFVDFMEKIQSPVLYYLLEWTGYALIFALVLLILKSFFMWEDKKRDWIIPVWFTFITALITTVVIKIIVARERPEEITGLVQKYSFPSTIVAICTSMATQIDHIYPSFKWFWILFALIISLSRLYLQLSFISDIIAGALIGFSLGLGMIYIKKKYNLFGANV